jgi:hypothetical protein
VEALAEVAVRNDGTFELLRLDERSWVDVARGWVSGADALHETLVDQAEWRQGRLWRYEPWVEEPRLYGSARPGNAPLHPVLPELQRAATCW